MGLADLKNTSKLQSKAKIVSIDDFINGAEFYAKGLPEIVNSQLLKEEKKSSDVGFKACTYTLDGGSREALTRLAEENNLAKSKLIRILLRNMQSMDPVEQALVIDLYHQD
jgi:hypothetical protein